MESGSDFEGQGAGCGFEEAPDSASPPYFAGLMEGQLGAAKHREGLALVNAGAGTGKTKTLVARYLALILDPEDPADINEVLAITYTTAGADEMVQRVRSDLRKLGHAHLARKTGQAWISTIHGFCGRVLRRYPLEAGIDPFARTADPVEADALKLAALDELFEGLFLSKQDAAALGTAAPDAATVEGDSFDLNLAYSELRSKISDYSLRAEVTHIYEELRKYGCDPAIDISDWEKGWPYHLEVDELLITGSSCSHAGNHWSGYLLRLVHAYARIYNRIRAEHGVLDFNELLLRTHQLLSSNEDVLRELQSQFRYVMIDEAQDTNPLQMAIVELFAGRNLFQVGDVKQSIYGFQGADPGLLHKFEERVSGTADSGEQGSKYELDVNFRSTQGVLGFANALFGNDELLGHKAQELVANKTEPDPLLVGAPVQVKRFEATGGRGGFDKATAMRAEAVWIADQFEKMYQKRGNWKDFAVLVQYRSHAEVLAEELTSREIPCVINKGSRLFKNPMVNEARVFLDVLAMPRDGAAFMRLLLGNMGRISDQGIYELARLKRGKELRYLWDAALLALDLAGDNPADPPVLSLQSDRDSLAGLIQTINAARERIGTRSLSEVLSRAFCERELDLLYLGTDLAGKQTYAGFQQFLRMADSWQAAGRDPMSFAQDLKQQEKAGLLKTEQETLAGQDEECVVISTIHGSKGLEYPVVALPCAGAISLVKDTPNFVLRQKPDDTLMLTHRTGTGGDRLTSPHHDELDDVQNHKNHLEIMRLLYVACTRAENQMLVGHSTGGGVSLNEAIQRGLTAADAELTKLEESNLLSRSALSEDETRKLASQSRALAQDATAGEARDKTGETDAAQSSTNIDAGKAGAVAGSTGTDLVRPEGPPRTRPLSGQVWHTLSQVSASDIQSFHACPRRFYLFNLLRLGELSDRDPTKATNKGSLIHLLLEWGNTDQAQNLFERNKVPDDLAEEIKKIVEDFQGSAFMKDIEASGSLEKEKAFYLRLSPEDAQPRYLKGYIDLLVWRDDGSLLIVDYKSGTSATSHEKYQTQADCYALAGLEMGAARIKVTMVRPEVCDDAGEPEAFDFEYCDTQRSKLRDSILESIAAMEKAETASIEHVKLADCKAFCPAYGSLCKGGGA